MVCRGPRLDAALASSGGCSSTAELYWLSLPKGGGAGLRQCSALKAIAIIILNTVGEAGRLYPKEYVVIARTVPDRCAHQAGTVLSSIVLVTYFVSSGDLEEL